MVDIADIVVMAIGRKIVRFGNFRGSFGISCSTCDIGGLGCCVRDIATCVVSLVIGRHGTTCTDTTRAAVIVIILLLMMWVTAPIENRRRRVIKLG